MRRTPRREVRVEDLKDLSFAQYIRDSTAEQAEGFGPEIQRRANLSFAERYRLVNSNLVYEKYVSAGSLRGRDQLLRALQDLRDGGLRQPGLSRHGAGGDLPVGVSGQVSGDDDAVIGELAENDHRFWLPRSGSAQIRTDLVRYRCRAIRTGQGQSVNSPHLDPEMALPAPTRSPRLLTTPRAARSTGAITAPVSWPSC